MSLARALVGPRERRQEGVQHGLRIHIGQDAVDRLEAQGLVVDVDHLHQRPAGEERCPLVLRDRPFLILIALFRRGQGVVAVPHGEEQRGRSPDPVPALLGLRGAQGRERVRHGLRLGLRDRPSLDGSASLLEGEGVEPVHPRRAVEGTDYGVLRVVDQEHHMGKLDGRPRPDLRPGRDAGEDRPLRGPDQGSAAGGEVVPFQIHHAHQSVADRAVGLDAFHIDQRLRELPEDPRPQILIHGPVDGGDPIFHVRGGQSRLGEDQPQGRGRVPHGLLDRLPILRLGGELVAGHHRPLRQVDPPGDQHVRRGEAQRLVPRIHAAVPHSAARMAPSSSGNSS